MPGPGIIVGLRVEARIVEPHLAAALAPSPSLPVACSGANAAHAAALAQALIDGGADSLISFGIAGGLDPGLKPGNVVIGDCISLPGGGGIVADTAWVARLHDALASRIDVIVGGVAGADAAVLSVADKAALHLSSGALAVDMESHAVARIAAATGRPFLVVRAIADAATVELPRAVLVGLGPDGGTRPLAVLGALARRPAEMVAVLRAARHTRAALASLRGVVLGAGRALFLP